MRHKKYGNMMDSYAIASGTVTVLLDNTTLSKKFAAKRNRWIVYDVSERFFGEWQSYKTRKAAVAVLR